MRKTHPWARRLIGGLVMGGWLSAGPAWAERRDETRDRVVRQAIQALMADQDAPVEITLANGTTRQGWLRPLGPRSFLIVDEAGHQTQVPYSQVAQSRRPSVGRVLVIAGVVAGVALIMGCSKYMGNVLCLPTE